MSIAKNNLLAILTELEIKHGVESIDGPGGQKAEVLIIHHGEWLLAAGTKGTRAKLVLDLPVDEPESKAIDTLPPDKRARLLFTTRRELLDGRTGFNLRWKDPTAQKGLTNIRLEQDLAMSDAGPTTAQRFIDAKQEIVTLAVRVAQVWALSFAEAAASQNLNSGTEKPDDVMYQ